MRREIPVEPRVLETRPAPPHVHLHDDLTYGVSKAMRKLLPQQAEIIRMVVDEKLTFEQIGSHYGIDRKSAFGRYRRAKESLKKELLKNDTIRELMEDEDTTDS